MCGPCSEIYYHTDVGKVEIWNLVFTQFNRVGDSPDNLRALPSKNIDTGMGLERTASVMQGVETNFHIDILMPLVEAAGQVCGVKYEYDTEEGRRLRRIADHIRACSFAVHENVYPGPNKEKYVIKRLLRRAVLDGHQMGVDEPFLHKLVPKVAEMMEVPYPELGETITRVTQVIAKEEENFLATIDAGLDRIDRIFKKMKKENRGLVSGEEVAEMYTTNGFPPELFETMAAEHNLAFDWDGYRKYMVQHGIDSGAGGRGELFQSGPMDALKKAMHESKFVGYEKHEVQDAKVVGIIANNQLCEHIDEIDHGHPIVIVLDETPFYGEMGGQVGDSGWIVGDGFRFEVTDCQVDGGFTLHAGHLRDGMVALSDVVTATVDVDRRRGIQRAHSATHLLHYALRKHLGEHAEQQGSKVDNDVLRFDFTNPKALGREMLLAIEAEVNDRILDGVGVGFEDMSLVDARNAGATMLFGEKYPDEVRVVSIGDFSKELCGGTHLSSTGQVGLFKVMGEESVAAGTRRIVALTGLAALDHVRRGDLALAKVANELRVSTDEVPVRVKSLAEEVRQLRKRLAACPSSGGVSLDELTSNASDFGGVKVISAEVTDADGPVLRQMIDQLRQNSSPIVVMLGSRQEESGKVTLVAGASREVVKNGFDSVKWIKATAGVVGGGGGGRPDMAQAGGRNPEKLPEALEVAKKWVSDQL